MQTKRLQYLVRNVVLQFALETASASHMAELMNMSPGTQQRKLAEEGTTVKQIVNDARQTIIRDQLRQGL